MTTNNGFVIVLVEPQLGENIGMVARAMLNCGLRELRLVNPRDGWPSDSARNASSGADEVIDGARLYDSTSDAIADLNWVLATTARPRDMTKRVFTAEGAVAELRQRSQQEQTTGIIFGKESWGLNNDDVVLADAVVTIPLNPDFTSLNLAQAVLVLGYEWFKSADTTDPDVLRMPADTRPANKDEIRMLYEHLEAELDETGFLRVEEKRPTMVRNIRNMLGRADMTEKEVRTFRGIISALRRQPNSVEKS